MLRFLAAIRRRGEAQCGDDIAADLDTWEERKPMGAQAR
jgi:hypothetical protein